MGILDFLKTGVIRGTKVLVCAIGPGFEEQLKADAGVYTQFYPATTSRTFAEIQEFIEQLGRTEYDVIHVLCNVSQAGHLAGSEISGTQLIETCCSRDVKLLWIGSSNPPDGYIQGFKAKGRRINLVMTIDRKGEKFPNFLEKLLREMSKGVAMPVAWNQLCPQVPGSEHAESPSSIYFAGLGDVRLR